MSWLLPTLPILALVLSLIGAADARARARASVWWCLTLAVMTEALSLFGALTPGGVAVAWLIVLGAIGARHRVAVLAQLRHRIGIRSALGDPLRAGLGLVVSLVLLTALASTPNTWDSMTYHLPRVMQWAYQADLAPFATHIDRQVFNPPFAEYVILHLTLLHGGDGLGALPQWGAWVGSMAVAGWFTFGSTGSRPTALLATLFVATMPMAILQASSTQNDMVTAYLLLVSVALLPERGTPIDDRDVAAVAAACGLAVLTKGTAYLFVVPVGAALVLLLARTTGVRRASFSAALAAATVLAINAPHWTRNVQVYESPLGPERTEVHLNAALGFGPTASNVLRNTASQFGFPSHRLNEALIRRPIVQVHEALGLDADDPATSWTRFRAPININHEDHAPSPVHTALALLAVPYVMFRSTSSGQRVLASIAVAGFVLFSAVLVWQPWQNRLLLPLLVLSAPLTAVTLRRVGQRWVAITSYVLLASSLLWVLCNRSRPLIGPAGPLTSTTTVLTTGSAIETFANRPEMLDPYVETARLVVDSGCSNVGLVLGEDDWEHPWWRLLNPSGRGATRLAAVGDHVDWRGQSPPCAVLWAADDPPARLTTAGAQMERTWNEGRVAVFQPR